MSSKSNSKGPSEEQFVPERTAHAEEITPEEQRQMSGHEKAKQKPSQSFSSVRDKVFRQPDEYIPRVNEDQDVVTSGQTASSSSNLFSGVTSIFQGAAGLGSTAFGAFIGGISSVTGQSPPVSFDRYAVEISSTYVNEQGKTITDSQEMEFGSKASAESYAQQYAATNVNSGIEYTLKIRGPYVSSSKRNTNTPPQNSGNSHGGVSGSNAASTFNARY